MLTNSALTLLTLLLIKPLLIISVIGTGLFFLRNQSAALRHFWLALGVIALLLLPVFFGLLPEIKWQILPEFDSAALFSSDFFNGFYRFVNWSSQPKWLMTIAAIYFLVMFWLLFYLALGVIALSTQTRRATRCEDSEFLKLLNMLQYEFGISQKVDLVFSNDVESPQMWGAVRPVIMLPTNAKHWSDERKLSVLLHELAHIARGDWLITVLVKICCAVFWFLPPVWWLANRLFHYAEMASDDYIYHLHNTMLLRNKEIAYAENLLAMAKKSAASDNNYPEPALPMASHSAIYYRIESILDRQRQRDNATPEARQYWVLALIVILLPIASLQVLPIQKSLITQMLERHALAENAKINAEQVATETPVHWLDLKTLLTLKQQLLQVDAPEFPLETLTVVGSIDAIKLSAINDHIVVKPDISYSHPEIHIQGYMPLETVIPIYPPRALQKGIEGEVIVEFSIADNGEIFEPRILSSKPVRIFDKAVLSALSQSRYQPQIIDGSPVILKGVVETFTFQIQPDPNRRR